MLISFIINYKALMIYVKFYYSVMLFYLQTSISLTTWRIHGDINMCSSSYNCVSLVKWYLLRCLEGRFLWNPYQYLSQA